MIRSRILSVACLSTLALVACSSDAGSGASATTAGTGGTAGTGSTSAAATAGTSAGTATGGGTAGVTFYEDLAPVIMDKCAVCHQAGSIGPFPMLTYEQAKPFGPAMAANVAARIMPPILADASGACNTFQDASWLTDEEIALFQAWVDDGLLEGDPNNAPPPPEPLGDLAGANLTLDTGTEYTPSGDDDYRCFVVDPQLTSNKYLTGFKVRPGDDRVVHHVILYAPDSEGASMQAETLDANEEGPGYTCFGGAGVSAGFVAGWAPGIPPTDYPEGTGIELTAGRKLIMQVHYNTALGVFPDKTAIDLRLEDQVASPAIWSLLANTSLNLPPGMSGISQKDEQTVPQLPGPAKLWGLTPHMHELGTALRVDLDGQCAMDIPRWDFNWQRMYFYETPLDLQTGQPLSIECIYDTTNQTEPVTWGEGTSDEMCLAFLYVSF